MLTLNLTFILNNSISKAVFESRTYRDKRRSCAAHPFRAQANLTHSWCNGAALYRTSSLLRTVTSCRWLVVSDTPHTSRAPPKQRSWGNKSARLCRTSTALPSGVGSKSANRAFTVGQFSINTHCAPLNIYTLCSGAKRLSLNSSHRWSGVGCLRACLKSLHWVPLPAHAAN